METSTGHITTSVSENISEMLRDLKKIGLRINWSKVGFWGVRTIQDNILFEGRPVHYAPLKNSTRTPLLKTRALLESVNHSDTKSSTTIGSGLAYGVFHITGTKRTPRRDYFILPPDLIDNGPDSLMYRIGDDIDKAVARYTTTK